MKIGDLVKVKYHIATPYNPLTDTGIILNRVYDNGEVEFVGGWKLFVLFNNGTKMWVEAEDFEVLSEA